LRNSKSEMKECEMVEKKRVPELRFKEFSGEWEEKKLGEVSYINPKSKEIPNIFKYIDLESVENGFLKQEVEIFKEEAPSRAKRTLENNDILYQTVRPYQKNNLFFNKVGNYVASTGYAQIRAKEDTVFLYQYLHNEKFVNSVLLRCTGTSYPAINSNDLSKIKISLPSLPEQEKIASFLSSVDKRIEQLTKKVELLQTYKKGVMQKIFSKEIRFKDENGEDYPDWVEKKLGEVLFITRGASPRPIDKFITNHNNGINWIKIGDIKEGDKFITSTNQKITQDGANKSRFIEPNDFILSNSMSFGRPYISKIYGCIHDGWLLLRNKNNSILSNNFLYEILSTHLTKKQFKMFASGSTVNNLKSETVSQVKIPLPCLQEQTKIANFLSSIDTQIEQTQKSLDKTKEWKKGLLQKMFV
jgi:type I restriction enzyme S subunit